MSYFIGFAWGVTVALLFAAIVERKWGCPYCHEPKAPSTKESK